MCFFLWDQDSKVISVPGMHETNVRVYVSMSNHLFLPNLCVPVEL